MVLAVETGFSSKIQIDARRRLWVLQGVLDYGLDDNLLMSIADNHRRSGTLPVDYFYPELYRTTTKVQV